MIHLAALSPAQLIQIQNQIIIFLVLALISILANSDYLKKLAEDQRNWAANKAQQKRLKAQQQQLKNQVSLSSEQAAIWSIRQKIYTIVSPEKASELLQEVRRAHPGQSAVWVWQKVLDSLKPDYYSPLPSSLKNELINRLGGNAQAADKVIDYIQVLNPKQSEEWCIRQALFDLEQERKHAESKAQIDRLDLSNLKQVQRTRHASSQVSDSVKSQLHALVNGNQKLANRLLEHTRKNNPTRSEQWIWEKTVCDLERDRRA